MRQKQQFADAIDAYDRVIARIRQPVQDDWVVYYSRGIAYERTGQWTRAEADFNHALELSPDQPSVLNYLGYSLADMGRNLDQAREMIQRAAARRPNDGAITDSLGWVVCRQGNVAEATKTAGTRGWAGTRRSDDHRAPRRCVLGDRAARSRRSISGGAR